MPRESIYKRYQSAIIPIPGNETSGYWFAFQADKLLVKTENSKAHVPCGASLSDINLSAVRTQYLGLLCGHLCYSAEIPPEIPAPEGLSFQDLRSLYSVLDEDIFLLAGKAKQIVRWDQTHQFCGRCGLKTEPLPEERARKCPVCGLISYPAIAPAVITAVFKNNQILLSHNIAFAGKRRSLIAGFVEPGETLEECACREILEEVGIRIKNLQYFGSQPWPFPNSLMIGFIAEYDSGDLRADGKEITETDWFAVNSTLPELPTKMSIAREIIDWFIQKNTGG